MVSRWFPRELAAADFVAMKWLEDLIRTYIERDVPQMGFAKVSATKIYTLWKMLAHIQGETINFSKLAANLEISRKKVNLYVDILSDLLLLRKLEPYHINIKKRLVKSQRYYIRDGGILHRLLNINSFNELQSHPIIGKSWEGFVVENIHSVLPPLTNTYFYRTAAGAEIDLVITLPDEIWAVEIKYGVAPKVNRHFSTTCDDIKANKKYVIYGGDEEFVVRDNITYTPLINFMQKLEAIGDKLQQI